MRWGGRSPDKNEKRERNQKVSENKINYHRALKLEKLSWITWKFRKSQFSSVQSLSRVRLFATPWITACQASLSITNSRSLPQTHVHRFSDAIQPSHPLSSPPPPAPNPSQHQGLFKWVSSSHQVAKVLEFQLQDQSFQWTPRTDLL